MTYRSKTNNPRRKILIIFFIIIFLIALIRFVFPNQWSYVVINTSQPFLKISQNVFHFSSNIKGNTDLEQQINDLKLQLNDRNLLVSENENLKAALGRNDQRNTIIAIVISKPTFTPYDTFIVDQGSIQGVKLNSEVLAGSSTSIGIVTEVYPNISKVMAYSSPGTRHPVYIGEKNIQAEAIGQGNGNYKIILPEGSDVKIGDNVVVPNIIPTIFGVVEKIIPSDQPSFINVLFKAPINLNELYYVQISR